MTTTLCAPVDFSLLWKALDNLGWHQIPCDLSEIDAAWCHGRLFRMNEQEIDDLLQDATWEVMDEFADQLREEWTMARIEAREFDREVSSHRDYV